MSSVKLAESGQLSLCVMHDEWQAEQVSGPEIPRNLESGGNLRQWSAKEQDFRKLVSATCHEIFMYQILLCKY